MFDAADLAVFVDPDMPGYVLALINGQPIGALFSAAYGEAFGLVGGTKPTLRVLGSVTVMEGDPVVIGSDSYLVASIERPLGNPGMVLLRLEAV